MRVGIRTIAGIAVSVFYLLPVAAMAITPDPVEEEVVSEEEPVVEVEPPVDPVPEVPVVDIREKSDAERPIKTTSNRPVVDPKDPVVVTPKRTEPEVKVYSYSTKTNYCGAGLQPVTVNGVVSCGRPNQSRTYQQMMTHPATAVKQRKKKTRRVTYHRSAQPLCRPGTKGCSDR